MTASPNVVLVTIDSLRADHCSGMGYEAETTPALDEMATDGATFTNAIAPGPSTPEAMPAVFTGRYPTDTVDPTDVSEARTRIRRHMETRTTIPERLSRRGYATAGFTPNPYTSRYFGFDAGFDRFEDFSDTGLRAAADGLLQRLSPISDAAQAVRLAIDLLRREEVFKPWEAYVDAVEAWIESAESPYFVWVHLMDPHVPYMPPRAYRRLSWWENVRANVAFWRGDPETGLAPAQLDRLRTAYDDAVRYGDAFLERLESIVDEDDVVVVHGDHGEAFGEHGSYGHEPYLYEENIHVPLVVRGVPSTTVDRPISLREVPSILGQVADDDWNPGALGGTFAVSRTANGERVALRGRRLKYIRSGAGTALYDLEHGEREPASNDAVGAVFDRQLERLDAAIAETRAVRDAVERVTEADA